MSPLFDPGDPPEGLPTNHWIIEFGRDDPYPTQLIKSISQSFKGDQMEF